VHLQLFMASSQIDDTKTYFEPISPNEPQSQAESDDTKNSDAPTKRAPSRTADRPAANKVVRKRYTFSPPNPNQSQDQQASVPQAQTQPALGNTSDQQPGYYIPDMAGETLPIKGVLDIANEGHGYLRPKFSPSNQDIYISQSQIRRFGLRPGDMVTGIARPPKERERYYGLLEVKEVNDKPVEENLGRRTRFEDLTAIYPDERIQLEYGKFPLSNRIIDLAAPIGKGQRGMIVSPPKAGKTTIMKDIAAGITANHPEIHLIAALIGERPEEVTDISRSVHGEVIASNFDEPAEDQCRVAEIALDRAKRLVELGKDVVILLDSITRLARAYNLSVPPSGRTLSGGFDPAALYPPKKFFGAARNCEQGGSLTIIATALIDTGSRMDDLIYEEFKGTGNMELHLDRKLAERRIYPAIDPERSGTRREELLYDDETYKSIVTLGRMLSMLNDSERTEVLVDRLNKTTSNKEFLETMKQ
jgi:transcription termination factor Rho